MPKPVEFDHNAQRWDQYKRFYREFYNIGIVQFATGELIVTRGRWDPQDRSTVNRFGVSYHMPSDPRFAFSLIDPETGERVRKTWISSAHLMVDHETRQVLRLGRIDHNHKSVPVDIAQHSPFAYSAGPGRHWVTDGEIIFYKPLMLTKEQKGHINDLFNLCRTADRLGVLPREVWKIPPEERGGRYSGSGLPQMLYYLDVQFADLTPFEKAIIARSGFDKPVETLTRNELRIQ